MWVKTAGDELFRGGMGALWLKQGVSYRDGAHAVKTCRFEGVSQRHDSNQGGWGPQGGP